MSEEIERMEQVPFQGVACPKKGGRYQNPHIQDIKRNLWDFFLWQTGRYDSHHFHPSPPLGFVYPNPYEKVDLKLPYVEWINHSTFHLHYKGIHFLTDPIWSSRCSPFSFMGPKRLHHPPLGIEELPKVNIVLISHDHYDHLDKRSILQVIQDNPEVLFIIPEGVGKWFKKQGVRHFIEMNWWEKKELSMSKDIKIIVTAVPSQHFSGRGIFNKNKTLWCGFVLQFYEKGSLDRQFYFVGDTGYNSYDFVHIGNHFGYFDLSLIPIGTYIPYSFMSPVHICPNKAVKIHQEVSSKLSVGMHWKTFCLSDEDMHQPPYDLYLAMKEENLDPLRFRVLEPGQRIHW